MVDSDADREQSEARWREAQSVLDGVPYDGAQRTLNHQTNARTWTAVGVLLVSLLVAIVYFAFIRHRPDASAQPPSVPEWRQVSGLSLTAVGIVIEIFGSVRAFRMMRSMRGAPPLLLARRERKQLMKEVRGQQPAVPSHLPLARELARRLILQSRVWFLLLGGAFIAIGGAVSINQPFNTFVAVVVTLMLALSALLLTRDNKMANRFLSQHPGPQDQESYLPF